FFWDIQIPTGTPIIIAITTDITTRDKVSTKSSQYHKLFTSQRTTRENKPTFHPETHQAIKAIIILKIKGEPATSPICSSVLKSSSTSSILSLTPSNNHCRLSFKKSRAVSTHSSKGILGINRSSSI